MEPVLMCIVSAVEPVVITNPEKDELVVNAIDIKEKQEELDDGMTAESEPIEQSLTDKQIMTSPEVVGVPTSVGLIGTRDRT